MADFLLTWAPAKTVTSTGIFDLYKCVCHNGLEFYGYSKEECEANRAAYYSVN